MTAPVLRARDRRTLGPDAVKTREVLLDALAGHLAVTPWHLAAVQRVTARCGMSAGTFYQYFRDLVEAVEALEKELRGRGEEPGEHLRLILDLLAYKRAGLAVKAAASDD
jgi:AcrR family transcriptional regulator